MKKAQLTNSRLLRNARLRLVAKRVWRDFVKNTGIHGVKYLVDRSINSGPMVKFFWSFVLVFAFLGSGLMLKVFWNRYQNNSMLTVIESFHVPSFIGSFPALTVCPLTPPLSEARSNMLQSLRLPENMSREEAATLLKNIFELTHPRSELYKEQVRMNDLLSANRMELLDLLKKLRGQCKDLVESCWWDEKKKSCEKLFGISYSYDGLCCSFNYHLEDNTLRVRTANPTERFILTAGYGPRSGLTLVFKGHPFIMNHDNGTIARITTNTVGLVLYVHHAFEYPNEFNLILQAGREMQLGVVERGNSNEPGISRRSEVPCATDDKIKIKYFSVYGMTNCRNSCRMQTSLSVCGCIPWQFAHFAKFEQTTICGLLQFKCLRENYRTIWSPMYVNSTGSACNCPQRCRGAVYFVKHTVIPIAPKRFTPSMIYHNISQKNAVLRVFMAQQVYEQRGSVKITNEIYLLSSVGGVFSLFLGCSILSIGEIVYFVLILIVSCYSITQKPH